MILATIDWNPILITITPSIASLIAAAAAYLQSKSNHGVINDVKTQTNGQMGEMQKQITALADNVIPVQEDTK